MVWCRRVAVARGVWETEAAVEGMNKFECREEALRVGVGVGARAAERARG